MLDPYPMYAMPDGIETRWASPENRTASKGVAAMAKSGRKGSPCLSVRAREEVVLAHVDSGSGMIRRIWATLNDRTPRMLRSLRLDFYWDGAEKPAVSAPLGDFFGTGLGRMAAFQSSLFSSPEGRSFNCIVPMPFRAGMKVTVTNESDTDLSMFFYDIDYTVGDRHGDDALYFHAHFRRERPTVMRNDYEIVPKLRGKGRFLGANIGVMHDAVTYGLTWWGEGECKIYLDGDDSFPTLCSTGTEDYIGTGWEQSRFSHLHQGCHVADKERLEYCFYRYHVPDPVYFREDIRVTMQQIGYWEPRTIEIMRQANAAVLLAGEGQRTIAFGDGSDVPEYGNFERQDDWSSCAYFYLDRPYSELPELDAVEKRIAGLKEETE